MKGLTIVKAVALVCTLSALVSVAEEKKDAAAPAAAAAAGVTAKAGDKGEIIGVIVAKKGGKITVKGDAGELELMPYWRGGAAKDGGGFDTSMMTRVDFFKVGDKVKVAWTMDEHARIDSIKTAK